MLKISLLFRNLQTSRTNNSRIRSNKNAKFSGYCFYLNTNIYGDIQICISVPLMHFGFALELSNIDLWNIDLLDTHLDLLDKDIPSKCFVCVHNVFKTSSRHAFKTSSRPANVCWVCSWFAFCPFLLLILWMEALVVIYSNLIKFIHCYFI